MTIKRVFQYVAIGIALGACVAGLVRTMNMAVEARDQIVIANEILSGRCVCEKGD